MTVTERAPLSRSRIVTAAIGLLDLGGPDQLSMRKLGAELGVEAMSLYNHVANKDDLLDAVADELYRRVLTAYGRPHGAWRDRARRLGAAYVDVAVAHPGAFTILVSRPPTTREGLRFMERVVAIFDDVTDDLRVAALAFTVVANWIVGTLVQLEPGEPDEPDGPAAEPVVEGFERVAAFRRVLLHELDWQERFDAGFETVLDGIEHRYFTR